MNAERHLRDAYQQWRQLAENEGQAIQTGDWMRVCECQKELKQLQPRLIQFTAEAQEEWTREGADRTAKENDFRELVKSLIEIEWHNNSLLNTRRQAAQAEFQELEKAGVTLKRIQRSYAPVKVTAWSSFS